MLLWIVGAGFIALGLRVLWKLRLTLDSSITLASQIIQFRSAVSFLIHLSEILKSGLVPDPELWNQLSQFPTPWNRVCFQNISELRRNGAPVLPTLHRFQQVFEQHLDLALEAKAKSAQAWAQTWLSLGLVPLFSLLLWWILPELHSEARHFWGVTSFAIFLCVFALIWIVQLIEAARWGHVRMVHRGWYGQIIAGLEQIWASVQAGNPADLAWTAWIHQLARTEPSLAAALGSTVWHSIEPDSESDLIFRNCGKFERKIITFGTEIRKSIQVSLMEGQGVLDRLDSGYRAFLTDYRLALTKELNLLPQRTLKPLFIFVAPSLMLVLINALWMLAKGF